MKIFSRKRFSLTVRVVVSVATIASVLAAPTIKADLSSFNMNGPVNLETIVPGLRNWTLDFDDGKVYWSDYSPVRSIRGVDPTDKVVFNVVTLSEEVPRDADVINDKVYFAKLTLPVSGDVTHYISRVDIDGTNMTDLVSNLGLGRVAPAGVAVSDEHIYWSMATNDDSRTGKIQRSDLNGNNVETLITGLGDPTSIVLDLVSDYMYWTDTRTFKIQRARLDGGIVEDIVSADPGRKLDLAVDVDNNKLYWVNRDTNKILRANLDGSNMETLLNTLQPGGIALDLINDKIYFTDAVVSVPAPDVSITSISAPEDGYLPFENVSNFPATVGSGPVRVDVTVGGAYVVDQVTVNGVEATGGPIDWTAGNVTLIPGANTVTAIATTTVGGSGEASVEVSLDLDLDSDGIENDVDRQITVPGIGTIGGPRQPSTLFSDQFGTGLGRGPIQVTISQDGGAAYISNYWSNTVSVLDTSTNEVVATVPVGNRPFESALTPDGGKLYVPNIYSMSLDPLKYIVSVVDTASNEVLSSIQVGKNPYSTGATQDGRVLVAEYGNNSLGVIDTVSDTRLMGIATSAGPIDVTMAPDRPRVYVSALPANRSNWIDTSTLARERDVGVAAPRGADTNPDGSRLFITEFNDSRVGVFDTDSGARTATIGEDQGLGTRPIDVAVTPDGLTAYVANLGSNTVSVIDTGTSTVTNTIPVQVSPYGLAISPDGLSTYVTNFNSHSVSVIDNISNTVVDTIVGGIDGQTYGLITNAGDQVVTVSNEDPEPDEGVRITVASGGGSAPASIDVCEWPFTLTFGAGSDLAFTCPGSGDVDVFTGPVELSFDTPDGILSSVTLDTGFSLLIESPEFVTDPQVLEVIAPLDNPGPVTLIMGEVEIILEPGDESAHSDGDGIPDDEDACPVSDLSETVVIDGCDSGVTNHLATNGCTISDDIAECAANAENHGMFISCVTRTTQLLLKAGVISGNEKDAIQRCAAESSIP